jgi:hypothetical protein
MRFLLFTLFLSFSVFSNAQNFKSVDKWLRENIDKLGGHAVLMIYKDGKLVYQQAENELEKMQTIFCRIMM